MSSQAPFATATMAGIFVDQGRYAEAAEIYRLLLERDPQRPDLTEALAKARTLALGQRRQALAGLFADWFHLMGQFNRLRRLNRLCRGRQTKGERLKTED